MKLRNKKTALRLGVTLAGASFLTLMSGAVSAQASTRTDALVKVPLTVVSGPAAKHNSGHGKATTISPNNTQTGDCGTAWMSIGDPGSGYADINLGASSTLGAIVYEANNWTGTAPDGDISGNGESWPFSGSFSTTYHKRTGYGSVSVTGSIYIFTDEGDKCYSKPLWATAWI